MRLSIGHRIAHESIDERGFVTRLVGTVESVERSLASSDGICVVAIESIYVYHRAKPTCGCLLPLSVYGKEALDCEQCAIIGGTPK